MKVLPLNDFIYLIEEKEEEHETESGFIVGQEGLPITGSGVIWAMPECVTDKEQQVNFERLKVGDKVQFTKFAAEEVNLYDDGKRIERLKSIHISSIHGKIL